jgi:hypothetical protein
MQLQKRQKTTRKKLLDTYPSIDREVRSLGFAVYVHLLAMLV